MRYFDVSRTLLVAVYIGSVVAATSGSHRMLRAATRRSDLRKRETRINQKFESEVTYIERENGWDGRETFVSSVKVGSRKPILSLEEIEHFLEDVECRDGKMFLHFVDAIAARDARAACHGGHGGTGGLIITSHQSCNNDGERAVYKIDDVTLAQGGVALDLAVTEALWQDAFDNIDINFGHTQYDHIYRRHSDFLRARRKRQAIEIPTDTPDNILDVKLDLTSELLNTTFSAADFITGLESFLSLPVVPDLPIEIGCKNCSTRGQIAITQGAIKIDTKQIDFVPDIFGGGDDGKDVNSIITGGEFDLAMTGFGARLEMFARPMKSGSYEIALFPLPVLGFVIPGIGQAGASFEPAISVDFEIEGELAINYGVDIAIPDSAGIKITLGNLAKTNITGIKGATMKALPFTSNVTHTEIALGLAFTPTIPIGFEFADKLTALVSVQLDLPRLDARLTPNAKKQCSLLENGNKTKAVAKPAPEDAKLGGIVLVEANMTFIVDVAADLTLPLLPAPFDSAGTTAKIFSTQMPLMTSCVNPVKGALKITQMTPAATIKADRAEITPAGATCTKHTEDKPCDCGTVTTTVYGVPPTVAPPVTSGAYENFPPQETLPPFEMTPYQPEAPTPPAGPETPVETPTGGAEGPHYPDGPTEPIATPTGGSGYGPGEQPPVTSASCISSETIRITISTAPASNQPPATPPIIIISAPNSKPCNSSTTVPGGPPPATLMTTTGTENGYGTPPATNVIQPPPQTGTDNGYGNPPATLTTMTGTGYGNPPATDVGQPPQSHGETNSQSQTKLSSAPATTAQTTSTPRTSLSMSTITTAPPHIEESKGFMAPPSTATNATSAPATETQPPEFTGAAVAGYEVLGSGWSGRWSLGVVVGGVMFGGLMA